MALVCLCLRSSQFLPNNTACPRDDPSVCALCGGGHVLVTATLFALSRMRVIRVTNKLRLYISRFGNVGGKKKCKKCCKLFWDTTRLKFKWRCVFCLLRWDRMAARIWFILSLWSCCLPVSPSFSPASRHSVHTSVRSCELITTSSDLLCNIIELPLSYGDRGSTVVKVLCYKSEGRWFDPR